MATEREDVMNQERQLESYLHFVKGLGKYLAYDSNWDKSSSRLTLVEAALAARDIEGRKPSAGQVFLFTAALEKLQKDAEQNHLVIFDNTDVAIDYLRFEEESLKAGIMSLDAIKETHEEMKGKIFKTVDFKAVEQAIENKDILKSLDLEGAKLENCNTNGLEHIHAVQENVIKFPKFEFQRDSKEMNKPLKQKKIEERERDLEKHMPRGDEDSFVFDNPNKKRYMKMRYRTKERKIEREPKTRGEYGVRDIM